MTTTPAVNPSRISQFLSEQGYHRFNATDGKGGFRVALWREEGLVVRVEYHGIRKDLGVGRFSDTTIARKQTEVLRKIRETLEKGGYYVGWGWDSATGEPDTSFLAITTEPRVEGQERPKDDPRSEARNLASWVENYLTQAKYLRSGSDPVAPTFGFDAVPSINGWGPTHVRVEYRPGQFEDYAAILHTVRSYQRVLSEQKLYSLIRQNTGTPVLYVTESTDDLVRLVEYLDDAEAQNRADAEEAARMEESEGSRASGPRLRSLLISLHQVEAAVREIQDLVGQGKEDEARMLEQQTYRSVLLAIVGQTDDDPADLAAAALETQYLSFRR